jgi:hypothetical protein
MNNSALQALDPTCLRVRLRELFGFEPRDEQVEAITTLAIAQEDLILIARTG